MIGQVRRACHSTPEIHLPPGTYRLRCLLDGKGDWKHTLWTVRKSDLPASGRLALITLGCYPEAELARKLRWIFASAARHGLLVHTVGVDQRYGNHYSRKVEHLFHVIQGLPDRYSHVAYLDGLDEIVLAGETEFQRKLDELGATVIGAEACAWPHESPEWDAAFTAETDQRFPQAGGWGGRIDGPDGVLATLVALQKFHYAAKTKRGPEWLYRDGKPIANLWDDQFMWQSLIRSAGTNTAVDAHWHVFANLTCTNTDPRNTDRFQVEGDRIVTNEGERPCAMHLSGPGKRKMDHWGHYLGAGDV